MMTETEDGRDESETRRERVIEWVVRLAIWAFIALLLAGFVLILTNDRIRESAYEPIYDDISMSVVNGG